MGILDFVKKQFIDIIQWTEEGDEVLAWRFPMRDFEIQQGAQLTVRETQMALFVHQGQVADLFGPGQHTIKTQNVPILTDLQHWDKMFESPFKSDVYFFSTRLRLDQKWGTSNPITIRDKEFGAVRLRTFGIYAYKIADPKLFFQKVSGTRETYRVADVEGQLRNSIVSVLTDHFAESQIPFLDMAANQVELAKAVGDKMTGMFGALGLSIENFQVQNVSLPEELQKRLDERIGMGVVGDMGRYTQFQTAQAIPIAAAAEGGVAGAGAGLGAGIAMGQAMGQALGQAAQGVAAGAGGVAASPAAAAVACIKCSKAIPAGTKFCPECGAAQALSCPKCNAKLAKPSKFCPECGTALG
ncbi:MAG: SPFH domain-containing protein [Nitrospirae bacterium]|nr:SPFH domain-containing protein [Nitrospirota bacterium]MBI3392952.1 SPFH domain-containing protein [Nitrospirota bacterium]